MIARILLPNVFEAWSETAQTELSAELTALVLEERLRRAAGGAPPLSDQRPSRVEGLSWIYEATEEGLLIHLDGELAHPGIGALPNRFVFLAEGSLGNVPSQL